MLLIQVENFNEYLLTKALIIHEQQLQRAEKNVTREILNPRVTRLFCIIIFSLEQERTRWEISNADADASWLSPQAPHLI